MACKRQLSFAASKAGQSPAVRCTARRLSALVHVIPLTHYRPATGRPLLARAAAKAYAVQPARNILSIIPWAINNGIQFAKIKPAALDESGSQRGIVATYTINPSECICSVPARSVMRVYPGCAPVLNIPSSVWQELQWSAQLALVLLAEKKLGSRSKFADYISILPTAVDVPVLWGEEDLQQLQCQYFVEQVLEQRQELAQLQAQLGSYLASANITQDKFLWAVTIVRSRTFAAPYTPSPLSRVPGLGRWLLQQSKDAQLQHALCPLLDMFNHNGTVQSVCELDLRSDAFRVVASQQWQQGEHVYINYGSSSNDALLQSYGFVEEGSVNDRYLVRCLPEVLAEQGLLVGSLRAEYQLLSKVAFTRQGLPSAAAAALQDICCQPGCDTAAANSMTGTDGIIPFAALPSAARTTCLHAVEQELEQLGDAATDKAVVDAFEQLPNYKLQQEQLKLYMFSAQAELGQLQGEVAKVHSSGDLQAHQLGAARCLQEQTGGAHQSVHIEHYTKGQVPADQQAQEAANTDVGAYNMDSSSTSSQLSCPDSEESGACKVQQLQLLVNAKQRELSALQEQEVQLQQLLALVSGVKELAVRFRLGKWRLLDYIRGVLQ